METLRLVHPFPALYSPQSEILILGSFPSVKSREQQFFYGHPQNRFWRMLACVYGEEVPATIEEKAALILRHRLALWDSVHACTITGSSDASMRDVEPNDISGLLRAAPIRTILLNGAMPARVYHRFIEPTTGIPGITCPSTSPANAAFSLADLAAAWGPYLTGEKA